MFRLLYTLIPSLWTKQIYLTSQALAKKGYYDHVIFHRVIKGFMVQTGDPLGDGTGGESVWGGEFEDEFVKTLKSVHFLHV